MKRIVRKTTGYILILAIVIFSFRLYIVSRKEVFDNELFTDYFQADEAGNGGLELTTSNFTTFEKEYNLVKEEVVEKKEKKLSIPEKKAEKITYKVQKRDTVQSISRKFGLKPETIIMNNKSAMDNRLKVGEVLTFPSINGLYYKLQKNETLAKVSKKYGVKVIDIVDYNNINPKKLKAGTILFLKGVTLKRYRDVQERLIAAQQAKEEQKKIKEQKNKVKKGSGSTSPDTDKGEDIGGAASHSGEGFSFPVRYAGVSSPFGNRYHPVLRRYILHTGVDLVAKYVPLRASKAGVVTFAGNMSGYGKIIIIKHDNGYETRYAHLSVISTNVGEHVNKGDLIGKTGNSGRTTGPHLHFEVRHNGIPKNPMKYLQ